MSSIAVAASNHTRAGATCRAAMGFSFAAGTTDGERLTGCVQHGWLNMSWPGLLKKLTLACRQISPT